MKNKEFQKLEFKEIKDGDLIGYKDFFYMVSIVEPNVPRTLYTYPKINLKRLTSKEQLMIIKTLKNQYNKQYDALHEQSE